MARFAHQREYALKHCIKHDVVYDHKCKLCQREYNRIYRAAHRKQRYEDNKKWRAKNKKKILAYNQKYNLAHAAKIKADRAAYYLAHKERMIQTNLAWLQNNPRQAYQKDYYHIGNYNEKRKELDSYFLQRLRADANCNCNFPPEMIEAKRVQIQLLRLIKELQT